jgi:EF-P beta-lysylation protein EpmB
MNWRDILRQNFTDWEKLATFLEWSEKERAEVLPRSHFPLNLPLRLAQKIQKGTLNDPILKQFLPTKQELIVTEGFSPDPLAELERKGRKLLHKYQGRALLIATSACAMHCRYCFRQNLDYAVDQQGFEPELEMIRADSTLSEIILSGGDPLSLSNAVLEQLISKLSAIPHIQKIRFHTRFPIGIPERIDDAFIEMLGDARPQIYVVIHTNHPLELDTDVLASLKRLQRLGIPILNHAVLLRGINDDIETHAALCTRLIDNGIRPYYLNQLDRVQGSAHFEVPEHEGLDLISQLRLLLPGYAIPTYAKELPDQPHKTPII